MPRIAAKYLAYRLVVSYVTVLLIMTLLFVLVRSTPGSLVDGMVTPGMSAADVEGLREQWGVNEPLWRQYLAFMINYQTGSSASRRPGTSRCGRSSSDAYPGR
ncbi:ABC transporter permease family protein [Halalkalicoccus salilacus]|uniref:hypothetical protein n=1 Tax=Halalkalicoccus sp. GCM10025704 TaxID=3252662 RepID=UPI00360E54C2